MGSVDVEHTKTDSGLIQGARTTPGHGHRTRGRKKKRRRPVTKTATSMDIAASGVQQGTTRGRGRPRKDTARMKGDTTARNATEELTPKQKADREAQVTVTTMVNYVARKGCR